MRSALALAALVALVPMFAAAAPSPLEARQAADVNPFLGKDL